MKLKNIFKRKYSFAIFYTILLSIFSTFVMLDALVLKKNVQSVNPNSFFQDEYESATKTITDNSYKDENISVSISEERAYDSDIHIADIKISNSKYLKTAFATDTFGMHIVEEPSKISKRYKAIFTINGDYYGFRDYGFVIRNKVMYRDVARPSGKDSCLLFFEDGSMDIIYERQSNLKNEVEKANKNGNPIIHAFSFGPTLVYNGKKISTSADAEDTDIVVNPRTAIGMVEPLHYIAVCVDGRTPSSRGVTVNELAEYMLNKNCNLAYNLDGGGSSTMCFNSKVINSPSDTGIERAVSDVVYFGY